MMDHMSKEFYLLFNDMKQNVEEYNELPVSEDELRQWKKTFKKNKDKKRPVKGIIAAACTLAVIGMATGPFREYASAAIGHVSYSLHEVLGIPEDLAPYETMIGKSVTKDGYTITLNSVIVDGDVLHLTYTEKHPRKLEGAWKIDGANTFAMGVINGTNHWRASGGTYRPVDDYTRLAITEMNFDKPIDLDKPVKIKLSFQITEDEDMNASSEETVIVIDGFNFVADGSQLALKTETFPLDHSYTLHDGSTVHFTRFETNPVSRKIFYDTTALTDNGYQWEIRIRDNLGNYTVPSSNVMDETGEGHFSYMAGDADNISPAATELIVTVWGGYMDNSGVEGEYMEPVGEFTIPLK